MEKIDTLAEFTMTGHFTVCVTHTHRDKSRAKFRQIFMWDFFKKEKGSGKIIEFKGARLDSRLSAVAVTRQEFTLK